MLSSRLITMSEALSSRSVQTVGLYPYQPNKVLPIIFAALIAFSLALHTYQNLSVSRPFTLTILLMIGSRYRFWRVTFFMFYAGLVFLCGWILRAISSHVPSHLGLFIAQTILTYAAPPIYAAAEYNTLGRLMFYLPMHAPLNPTINTPFPFFLLLATH